jgi:ABC-type bacteriocin/lantibiotic exporter with double-glycine peptidase domain
VLLSNIEHRAQRAPERREADCLVACAAMVLDYLGIRRQYGWLSRVLETTAIGTPFSHLEKLRDALGVGVELGENGTLATFEPLLDSGLPIIVAVDTDDPEQWPHYPNHAVVVVGFSTEQMYVNNPAVSEAPQEIEVETFLWAWSRRDYEYAVIRLAEEPG